MSAEKRYYGIGATNMVDIEMPDGTIQRLNPRTDLRGWDHGFDWGSENDGSMQLSLALCCDVLDDDARAQRVYKTFCQIFVAKNTRSNCNWDFGHGFLDQMMKVAERDYAR